MRSHTRIRLRVIVLGLTCAVALLSGAALVRAQSVDAAASRPGDAEIARALETVKADPNLATERTISTLRWKDSGKPTPSGSPMWVAWIGGLFGWLAQSARVLLWGGAVALAGLLVVYIVRLVRARGVSLSEETFVAPTHVRDLDIRPESLPDDLGAAARALWDRGEHRAALALLYRGMLSRLAHVHHIPIRDSSTEGDCLALAAQYLTQRKCEYTSRLVLAWQRFVYAGQEIQTTTVYVLCDDFAPALDAAAPPILSTSSGETS